MTLRRLLPALLVSIGFFVPGNTTEGRQDGCPDIPTPGTETLELIIKKNGGTCFAEAGDYVKRLISYKIHTIATATGQCQIRLPCGFGEQCTCKDGALQLRGVSGVGNSETNAQPGSPFNIGPIYPNAPSHVQYMSSQASGTTIPEGRNWTPWYVGYSTINQFSSIAVTSCNLTPNTIGVQRPLVVVSCLPRWHSAEINGLIQRFPDAPLSIAYPPEMETDVQAVADEWRTRLASLGLTFTFNWLPGSACAESDERCIQIAPGQNSEEPLTCAWSLAGYGPGQEYANRSQIWLRQNVTWQSGPRRTALSHEFGHLFGLEELTDVCSQSASVMHPAPSLDCNNVGSMPPLATASDALPVANTVYGGGSTYVCG